MYIYISLVKIHRKTKSKVALKFVDRKGLSKMDEKLVMMEVSSRSAGKHTASILIF